VLTKEESLRLFASNPFKVSLITAKIPDGGKVTAYRCGTLIDLCTGPHIPSTKIIKAFKVMKNSSAYWLGNAENDSLQRVYGVTFPTKAEMDEYIKLREEAAKRDHRTIGKAQGLFDSHQLSPGCAFMYPRGTYIYNGLMDLIREQYRVRGFQEVISPNIFHLKLWKTSGHYEKYQENIFLLKAENQGFGVKPMNCPAHCLMFANEQRTYKELPVRFADFGVLHRNEISGALSGLTRVRRFCQDDAHQFCTEEQMMDEILGNLDFLDHIYGLFGFRFELELSTRPEKRLGADELWDKAEAALENALNKFGRPWKLNPGDGAFYGPKIDIKVFDAFKRAHQCGTVQLDFQNPIRFNLQYKTAAVVTAEDNKHEAPIVHEEHFHAGSKTESTKVQKPGTGAAAHPD
jgi:threonyl-tRNA synthetase